MAFKRKFAIVAVPAVLALAGGAVAVHAATPNPAPTTSASDPADPAEATTAETPAAAEKPEAPEAPGTTDAGHADPAGDVNHEASGEEK
jgi:hypothetical protein